MEIADRKGKATSATAHALWSAIELATRGGMYARARELLTRYEETFRSHTLDRRWLRAWLAYRVGDLAAAREGFERLISDLELPPRSPALHALWKRLIASNAAPGFLSKASRPSGWNADFEILNASTSLVR